MASGGISGLLDLSRRSLFTQSRVMQVIGNNIANANNEAYSRRRVELESEATVGGSLSAQFGTGVDVSGVIRVVDSFLNAELQTRIGERAKLETREDLLIRAEQPFVLDKTIGQIGEQITEFFAALDDLVTSPSNIALRQNVIERGEDLATAVSGTYNTIADLQREADSRIGTAISEVNRLTSEIADLNTQVASVTSLNGQENLTLLDERDALVQDLAELIDIQTVTNSDGAVIITLSNGFGLVTGVNSLDLEFTSTPDFGPLPPGLDGTSLGNIVYDFDSATATTTHVDLTQVIGAGSGELGGLLTVRGIQTTADTTPFDAVGDLVSLGARIDSIARDLLTRFNQAYLGTGAPPATAFDLNGNQPGAFGLFQANGLTDDDADGVAETADLTASSLTSFAGRLEFSITDPAAFAAAIDLGGGTFASGDGSNIPNLTALRTQGVNYALGDLSSTQSIEDLFHSTVSFVGGLSDAAQDANLFAQSRETQVLELRNSVSAVSIDEEFSNLITYQKAFEGSARMIRLADDLLTEIIGLLN